MEPPFYSVEVNVLVNQDVWKGLSDAQRKVLNDAALWLEGLDSEKVAEIKAQRERQAAAGIAALEFGAGPSKAFLDRAYEVAWQSVIKRAPETGPKLRQLAGN
jgi:TRAP-type C4-dicarboxylate transport system substrate-binding protein